MLNQFFEKNIDRNAKFFKIILMIFIYQAKVILTRHFYTETSESTSAVLL